jgi:hypothetical protein
MALFVTKGRIVTAENESIFNCVLKHFVEKTILYKPGSFKIVLVPSSLFE